MKDICQNIAKLCSFASSQHTEQKHHDLHLNLHRRGNGDGDGEDGNENENGAHIEREYLHLVLAPTFQDGERKLSQKVIAENSITKTRSEVGTRKNSAFLT